MPRFPVSCTVRHTGLCTRSSLPAPRHAPASAAQTFLQIHTHTHCVSTDVMTTFKCI